MSDGQAHNLCFKHSFMLVKSQIKRLGDYEFGIYLQQVVIPEPKREIAPEARHAVTTPEDRQRAALEPREDESLSAWDF